MIVPEIAAKTRADLDRVAAAMSPYGAGHYLNFVEEKSDPTGFFPTTVATRLEAARAQFFEGESTGQTRQNA